MFDIQLKRGMLEQCVLRVLSAGDSYGYQIIKDMSACVEMTESTLYPILRRLEAAGALTAYTAEHGGRLRKYYSITAEGERRLAQFLEDWQQVMEMYEFIRGEEKA